jgi:hypothetical protein
MTALHQNGKSVATVGSVEALVKVAHVILDSLDANPQIVGDFFAALAFGKVGHQFQLARGRRLFSAWFIFVVV